MAGPTQSGKTCFTFDLINNIAKLISPTPTQVIWCYGEYQDKLAELPSFVKTVEGLEGLSNIDKNERNLIILDDLMNEGGNAQELADLFTKGSHHRNLSVIMIVQNLFHQGKIMRTLSLNAHYLLLFKNPRDASQVRYLGNQLFPGKSKFFTEAYKQATLRPHGYLLLDLTQRAPENKRVLSDILPSEEGYYYIPK